VERFRYHLVIASVVLTLWSASRAKALVGASDLGYYSAPPRMEWLSDLKDTDGSSTEDEIERELADIQW